MSLYFILAVPVVITVLARIFLQSKIDPLEFILQITIAILITAGVYQTGKFYGMTDTEILNGSITSKTREHGKYVRSYDCRCRQSCRGTGKNRSCRRVCQTCYEDRFTVNWRIDSTLGQVYSATLDKSTRSVYNAPDSSTFANAYVGQACSKANSYQNYILGVPESLFSGKVKGLVETYQEKGMIPSYPKIYNYYHVDHVLSVGVAVNEIKAWRENLANELITIGPSKQANIIVVIVNTDDPNYRYALETAWGGGKKNDVIVIIGSTEYPNIDWVDTITLGGNTGNSLMTVLMRDRLMESQTLDSDKTIGIITDTVIEKFDREPMANFEYLKDEVRPPSWVIILAFLVAVIVSTALTILFYHVDVMGSILQKIRS